MATIKSHSDLDQSRKLAEILPLESADMLWEQHGAEPYVTIKPWTTRGKSIGCHCLSCWSLAALLDIFPKIHGVKPILDLEENSIQYTGIDLYVVADNPVDACVAMIIKLHEFNLL